MGTMRVSGEAYDGDITASPAHYNLLGGSGNCASGPATAESQISATGLGGLLLTSTVNAIAANNAKAKNFAVANERLRQELSIRFEIDDFLNNPNLWLQSLFGGPKPTANFTLDIQVSANLTNITGRASIKSATTLSVAKGKALAILKHHYDLAPNAANPLAFDVRKDGNPLKTITSPWFFDDSFSQTLSLGLGDYVLDCEMDATDESDPAFTMEATSSVSFV